MNKKKKNWIIMMKNKLIFFNKIISNKIKKIRKSLKDISFFDRLI